MTRAGGWVLPLLSGVLIKSLLLNTWSLDPYCPHFTDSKRSLAIVANLNVKMSHGEWASQPAVEFWSLTMVSWVKSVCSEGSHSSHSFLSQTCELSHGLHNLFGARAWNRLLLSFNYLQLFIWSRAWSYPHLQCMAWQLVASLSKSSLGDWVLEISWCCFAKHICK